MNLQNIQVSFCHLSVRLNTLLKVAATSLLIIESSIEPFYDNTEFTYEIKNDGKRSFLDVLVINKNFKVETTVYRKSTKNDTHRH